jgi:hypothetical protein
MEIQELLNRSGAVWERAEQTFSPEQKVRWSWETESISQILLLTTILRSQGRMKTYIKPSEIYCAINRDNY